MNDRTMFKVSNEDVWQCFHEAEVLVSHRDLLPDIIWSKLGFTAWMFLML
jgi:hypothetical protein